MAPPQNYTVFSAERELRQRRVLICKSKVKGPKILLGITVHCICLSDNIITCILHDLDLISIGILYFTDWTGLDWIGKTQI